MVTIIKIGVLSFQGAVSEHFDAMKNTLNQRQINGSVIGIRTKTDLKNCDALILPGGESTTISRFLIKSDVFSELQKIIEHNTFPVMGTCAGCVLLAKSLIHNTGDVSLLQAMDMEVERNAFGRQRESFEHSIEFNEFTTTFNAVFIRAPRITKTWGKCKVLSTFQKKIIAARQGCLLALSFHPELTQDFRIHSYFLDMFL